MAVPETPMDEDGRAVFGEDDVGGARELFIIYAVTEAKMPESMAQFKLRLCCHEVNGRHITMALLWG